MQFNITNTNGFDAFFGEINGWYMLFGICTDGTIELGTVIGLNDISTLPPDHISHMIEIARPAIEREKQLNIFSKN